MPASFSDLDERYMAACLRLARRHRGQTANNPAVGTLLLKDERVVGRGITARGGRPHAETLALREAGDSAKGATAYVTLEPCAHHGVTPPCAAALIEAGVARVMTAWTDPDSRVDGQGHEMLIDAGVTVEEGICAKTAEDDLRGYLNRKTKNRPEVILKLALSADGKIGRSGEEVVITGDLARAYGHRVRAEVDGILVGTGTLRSDDPMLDCRLPGLSHRSPHRFVLDAKAELDPTSKLARSAHAFPVSIVTTEPQLPTALKDAGVRTFAAELHEGHIALPELLEDMATSGISTLLVEGGAKLAQSLLQQELVDTLMLFVAPHKLGSGIESPVSPQNLPKTFSLNRVLELGPDKLHIYQKDR